VTAVLPEQRAKGRRGGVHEGSSPVPRMGHVARGDTHAPGLKTSSWYLSRCYSTAASLRFLHTAEASQVLGGNSFARAANEIVPLFTQALLQNLPGSTMKRRGIPVELLRVWSCFLEIFRPGCGRVLFRVNRTKSGRITLRVVTIIDNVPIKIIDAQRQRGSLRPRSVSFGSWTGLAAICAPGQHGA
jgi:hypothetical protein